MAYKVDYAYTCHIGKIRSNNEDNFWCCGDKLDAQNQGLDMIKCGCKKIYRHPMLAVFDGMGGESQGEMAAFEATQKCGDYYDHQRAELIKNPEKFLNGLCAAMNNAVCEYSSQNHISSMGTTTAILTFAGDRVFACNIGDSRIYNFDGQRLGLMSKDHVTRRPFIGKAPLTQYLGMDEENISIIPSISHKSIIDGEKYLLCSDGVTDMLSDEEIADILNGTGKLTDIVGELADRALEKGGRDNITIVLCRIIKEKNILSKFFDWLNA